MSDPLILLAIAVIFVLAGLVKGVIGMGLPTVAMGLLSLVIAPAEAATVLIVPSVITNVWQSFAGPHLKPLALRLWPMLAGAFLGTVGGALLLGAVSSPAAIAGLGFALALYGAIGLTPLQIAVPRRSEMWLGPLVGLTTGIISAATGIFALPAVIYLQALKLDRDELVQGLGLSFMVSTAALGLALAYDGRFEMSVAGASVLALAAAGIGMALGQMLRSRTRPELFRTAFFVSLILLGVYLALKSLT